MSDYGKPGSGIGARLLRKEDARHLHGRATFVSDIALPGLMEVAFVRSPLAHARIKGIGVPPALRESVYTAAELTGVKPMQANNSIPGFKSSDYPILATGKVRFA
ncbi:MAG TPA: xanthine dehydrogenase family protein molybdopterin-binding subunit, partial [Alphaproteobacteria bacterium]|nr:xanthine dehydrogenase family protein molybdopterin-binding subunit [Alphaproteobacteria bacterium]